MKLSAIYHRPESEFAYLYTKDKMRIRIRTACDNVQEVYLIMGDPYLFDTEKWYLKENPMRKGLSTELYDYWEIEVDSVYHRLQYAFKLVGNDGQTFFYSDQGVYPFVEKYLKLKDFYFRMPYFQDIDRFKAPDWVKQTVWYQIFPERFANGDSENDPTGTLPWGSKLPTRTDFFGGDLQGVIDHLDYLANLGINGIYFCPIFEAASNHKYDTIDYYEIDPAFGDKRLFRQLVEEAHKREIKIMLDAVFNHIGANSPQWQDVIKYGTKSKYKDWFHINSFPITYEETTDPEVAAKLSYETFSFSPQMPKLNTANPEVQDYLLAIASYWIKEFDIDAWRLDVANEVDHHFWKRLRQTVDDLKPDFYLLGEIWHSSQRWLQGDEFHAVMNYAFTNNIKEYFVHHNISLETMFSGMNQQQMLYQDQVNEVTFNLLDSHDTPRILTLCQNDKQLMKAVMTFMFLQKGAPCIYYGTEIGLKGDMDPDCRRCMIWDKEEQDQELRHFFKQLILIRKVFWQVLAYGEAHWGRCYADKEVIYFERKYHGQCLVGCFNETDEQVPVKASQVFLYSKGMIPEGKTDFILDKHDFILQLKSDLK